MTCGRAIGWLACAALAACGGKSAPVAPPAQPPPPQPTRVPIEDSSTGDSDDGVQIQTVHGHMEPQAVQAGIAPHQSEMSDCYMRLYNRRRWLGGHVLIHWDIKRDGTVTAVKLMQESDLGAWPIEKCLLDVARSASFDKPIGGDADFSLPLDFTAKGTVSSWTEDQALRAVGGQLAKLDACAKALKKAKDDEAPPSEVTITVYVGPHGHAQSVGFSSDQSEIGEHWADCAEKSIMTWRLPDPHGVVAKLAVRYR